MSRNRRSLFVEGLCAFVAVCSFPRAAFAHGETLLGFFFWELMVVPWAVMVFVMARRRVFDRVARIMQEEASGLFQDFVRQDDGSWVPEHRKV